MEVIEKHRRKKEKKFHRLGQLENDNACGSHASFALVQTISTIEIHTAKL